MSTATTVPSVVITRTFNAPRERVFAAWTDPALMNQWFAPSGAFTVTANSDAHPGGSYQVQMHQRKAGTFHTAIGKYLEVVPPEKIVFTWDWKEKPIDPAEGSIVTIELRDLGDKTELTLIHAMITDDTSRAGHTQGWTRSLNRLAQLFDPAAIPMPIPSPTPPWME